MGSGASRQLSTRRSFVKGAAFGVAACGTTLMGGRQAWAHDVLQEWDVETDVVVIGGGGSGFSAALAAAEAGAEVVILEKGSFPGGSTLLCGQAIMGVGTSVQKEMGIEDSVEEAMKYFSLVGDGREDLLRLIVERSGAAVDWLIGLGMEVPAQEGNPGLVYGGQELDYADITAPIMRTHYSVKPEPGLWPVLEQAANDNPSISVVLECAGSSLVQESPGGEVLGVIAADGTTYRARRGVILAAGGYARNADMMTSLISRYEVQTTANVNDMGDGINLGIRAGASTGYFGMLSNVQYSNPISPCVFIVLGPDTMEGKPPFICVNVEGKRWSNERKFYSYICSDLLTQPEGRAFVVTCGEAGLAGLGSAADAAFAGETIEDLAAAMGVDAAVLAQTIDEWNADCAVGVDAHFGRTMELYPLEAGPYYAAEVKPGAACTFGGVTVDADMHALGALDGKPIPRLYAAGINSMAIGRFYPTCGFAVASAIVTGRIAGEMAAQEGSADAM